MTIAGILILIFTVSSVLAVVGLAGAVARVLPAGNHFTVWRGATGKTSKPARPRRPATQELAGTLRLPRFDRGALRTASTSPVPRHRQDVIVGGFRFVQRDLGRDRMELLVEGPIGTGMISLMPVTVSTGDGVAEYLLLFRAEESGRLVAAVNVPRVRDWADVYVGDLRTVDSLAPDDAEVVKRSVQAAPGPWISAWREVAEGRPGADPVSEAIARALRR